MKRVLVMVALGVMLLGLPADGAAVRNTALGPYRVHLRLTISRGGQSATQTFVLNSTLSRTRVWGRTVGPDPVLYSLGLGRPLPHGSASATRPFSGIVSGELPRTAVNGTFRLWRTPRGSYRLTGTMAGTVTGGGPLQGASVRATMTGGSM